MNKSAILILSLLSPVLFVSPVSPTGTTGPYGAILRKSYVRFTAHTNIPLLSKVKAVLRKFEFKGYIDAANPASSHAVIVLDMSSIESESFLVSDSRIREALQTDRYPESTLETRAVRVTSEAGVYDVDIAYSMMGKSYEGTVRTKAVPVGEHLRLLGSYEMQSGDSDIRVTVEFSIHAEPGGGL